MKAFPRTLFISLIAFLVITSPVSAQEEDDQSADILVLSESQEKYPLGPYLEILKDTSGVLTIQEVASQAYQDEWFTSPVETPNFGFQTIPYWVRFRIRNESEQDQQWVLALGFKNMHYMDLYTPDPSGENFSLTRNGIFSGKEIFNNPLGYLSFNISIPAGIEQTYYLRLHSDASMTLSLKLWSQGAYDWHQFLTILGLGAFFGVLIIHGLYNATLYLNLREKEYLFLALFNAGTLVLYFCYDALIAMIIPAVPTSVAKNLILIAIGVQNCAFVKFIDEFIKLKKYLPKIHTIANLLSVLFVITGFTGLVLPYNAVARILLPLGTVVAFLILLLNLYLLIKYKNREARFIIISLMFYLISAFLINQVRLGLIPSNFITEEFQRLSLIWMVSFWSLAMADRVHNLRDEAETSRRQIEESEQRLAEYLDSMPFGVAVYDADFQLRYINQQSKQMLKTFGDELSFDQIIQSSIDEAREFLDFKKLKTDKPYPIEELPTMQAIQQKKPVYIDDLEINLGDQSIPLEVWCNPMVDSSGETIGIVIAFQNIQDRLLQEDLLRKSEEFRQKILKGSSIGTWMYDLVSEEMIWDSRTREIYGLASDEPITYDHGLSLVHPEDHWRAQQAFDEATSEFSEGTYKDEFRIINHDDQVRWISTRGNIIYEEKLGEEHAVRMVGIVMDITEQKQAEKELEESRIQYQKLIETMNEGLAIVDENLILTYVNPRLPEMLGYTQVEMIGSHVNNFFDQANFNTVAAQFEKRRTGQEQSYTVTFRRKDGTDLHTLVAPAVVLDENGKFQQSIAVISDITEQVETHQRLDDRMQERTRVISSLMKVSRIVVSSLTIEDQVKIILQELKHLIKYDGASVLLYEEKQLITDTFKLAVPEEILEKLIQPFKGKGQFDPQFMDGDSLIFPNIRGQAPQEREFFNLTEALFGSVPNEMISWIGIPINSRNSLIGVLSAHTAQEDYFTHEISELMQAFANQIALVFENNRLYAQAQLLATATERDRLARELHDSVTQSLYSVRLYAEAIRSALKSGKLLAAEKNLEQLTTIARDGMSNLRLLIFELRPPVLEELGLIGALQKRVEMVENRAGIQAELSVVGEPNLPQEVETQLYWVVYELLSNVLKHARAKHVSLRFEFSEIRTSIILHDDGVGFDPARLKHMMGRGLKNIIDRVEIIGGKIEIDSKPGEGTSIRIVFEDITD